MLPLILGFRDLFWRHYIGFNIRYYSVLWFKFLMFFNFFYSCVLFILQAFEKRKIFATRVKFRVLFWECDIWFYTGHCSLCDYIFYCLSYHIYSSGDITLQSVEEIDFIATLIRMQRNILEIFYGISHQVLSCFAF